MEVILSNEFIEFIDYELSFTDALYYAVGAYPTGAAYPISYRWPSSGTSNILINVNGTIDYLPKGTFTPLGPLSAHYTAAILGVAIEVIVSIVTGQSGNPDVIKLEVICSGAATVGLRVLWDTFLYGEDSYDAPNIEVNGVLLTEELECPRVSPTYVREVARPNELGGFAYITAICDEMPMPDRVVVGSWPSMVNRDSWDYALITDPELSRLFGDNAVGIWWENRVITPEAPLHVWSFLGLSKAVCQECAERDDFTGGELAPVWHWETPGPWYKGPSEVVITSEIRDIYQHTAGNSVPYLYQHITPPVAGESVTVTTKVSASPTTNFQQGGIVFMGDNDNYVRFTFGWWDRVGLEVIPEWNANTFRYKNFPALPPDGPVWLRVLYERRDTPPDQLDWFSFFYSTDGLTFYQFDVNQTLDRDMVLHLSLPFPPFNRVGITAFNAAVPDSPSIPFTFDFFEISHCAPIPPVEPPHDPTLVPGLTMWVDAKSLDREDATRVDPWPEAGRLSIPGADDLTGVT